MSDPMTMSAAEVEALPEAAAGEVLAAWVKAKRAELPEALVQSRSKVHAKLAKKALYQLRSSGVAVKEAEPEKGPAPAAAASPREELMGVISPMLGTGDRAIFFARPMRGGGVEVVQGIINDELGLTLFESGASNKSTFKRRLDELRALKDLKVLIVPWERMRLELGRGLALCERTRTVIAPDAENALRRFGVTPEDPEFPIPALEAGDEALAINAASLAKEQELAQWLPPDTLLTELVKEHDSLEKSPLTLTGAQKRERLEQTAQALAQTFLTAPMRQRYARRLWGMAELFDASGRAEAASLARAEARRLFHTQGESRFVASLFHRAVELTEKPVPEVDVQAPSRMPAPRRSRP